MPEDNSREHHRSNPPNPKLRRRDFLQLSWSALKIGLPIGLVYYIAARIRSYWMFSKALETFNLDNLPEGDISPLDTPASNGWNKEEIAALTLQSGKQNLQIASTTEVEPTPVPSPTPVPRDLVDEFILGDGIQDYINLADSRRNILMLIVSNNGTVIPTSRATPILYTPEAVQAGLFDFYNMTIMSYLAEDDGDATYTWAHAGIMEGATHLFCGYLERAIRMHHDGYARTAAGTIDFIEKELIGAKTVILQEEVRALFPITPPYDFDVDTYRRANMLEMKISAAARIPNNVMYEYGINVNSTAGWLNSKPKDVWQKGWEDFNPNKNWTLKTCLGSASDEPGPFELIRNRLIISMIPVVGLKEPVYDPRQLLEPYILK